MDVGGDQPLEQCRGDRQGFSLHVRPIAAGDVGDLEQLAVTALTELRTVRGGSEFLRDASEVFGIDFGNPRGRVRWWGELGDPTRSPAGTAGWVARLDGATVGLAVTRAVAPQSTGSSELPRCILCVFVDPPARCVGAGESLMEAVTTWSEERGCASVESTVLPGDRATKNFFERAGFKARLIVMSSSSNPTRP